MSTISSSTTSTTAYKVTADTTGTLVIQTGATPTTAVTVGTDQVVTLAQALPVASGGTGATSASAARTSLGLVIGTDVLAPNGSGASLTSLNASNISSGTLAKARLPTGTVLQVVTTTVDGVLTTTTQGAPSTITNGVQVFSASFTPTSATSVILVQTSSVTVSEETNFGDTPWLALWDGSTFIAANSGSALYTHFAGNLNMSCISLNNSYSAGSTSTRTISVRAGINNGAGTTYVNGNSSIYNYTGSSARIQMTVWEIAA